MNESILEIIKDSDKILIGIGERFEYSYGDFRDEELKELEKSDFFKADLKKFLYRKNHPDQRAVEAYNKLYELIKDKDYFVVSTCLDDRIYESNFPEEKIVTPCGTYRYMQCSANTEEECSKKLLPVTMDMFEDEQNLICPVCGKALCFNHIYNENYNEGGYQAQWAAYRNWLQFTINKKLCILELGVSLDFPNVIRWPFEKMGFYNNKAKFIRVHDHLFQLTEEIANKGISVAEHPIDFLLDL